MNASRWALATGIAAFAIGATAAYAPGVIDLGLSRTFAGAVALLALLQAFRLVRRRRRARRESADPADPERRRSVPVPGSGVDRRVGRFVRGEGSRFRDRRRARDRLTDVARAVLARYGETDDPGDALTRGTWSDDPHATALFRDDPQPIHVRIRAGLTPGAQFRRRFERAVDALAEHAGVDVRGSPSPPGSADVDPPDSSGVDREHSSDLRLRRIARRSTEHWTGVGAVALLGIGIGVLVQRPAVVLAGVVGIGYAAFARVDRPLDPRLSLERHLEDPTPDAGDVVGVTLTVRNEGERIVPDCRLLDGVPEALAVVKGSPRLGTSLRPGETATIEYAVRASRGEHRFRPATALLRPFNGAHETEFALPSAEATTLVCVPPLEPTAAPIPLRPAATRYAGRVATDRSGEGVEFASTRAYRPGDPLSRIDWNRRARGGDLATLEFREERAATVLLVIDAREPAYRASAPGDPNAVDLSVGAAGRAFARLLDDGDRVGLASMAPDASWLAPGSGRDHRVRARELLAAHPSLASTPPSDRFFGWRWKREIRARLSGETQLLVFSPLCDDEPAGIVREFDAHGHPVTVVSPDVTADRTAGQRLARIERALRIADLRGAGIPVVDWDPESPFDRALYRADRRGSR